MEGGQNVKNHIRGSVSKEQSRAECCVPPKMKANLGSSWKRVQGAPAGMGLR